MTENEIIDFREQQAQHHARLRKIEGLMQYLNPLQIKILKNSNWGMPISQTPAIHVINSTILNLM